MWPSTVHTIRTTTSAETRSLGVRFASALLPGDVILLHGDLGAGKTTLTQGIARGLGITGPVQSPTFTLVAEHNGRASDGTPLRLYHLDLYRLGDEDDLAAIGFDDLLAPSDGVSIIEWPERAGAWLPDAYVLITIDALPDGRRGFTVSTSPEDADLATRLQALDLRPDYP